MAGEGGADLPVLLRRAFRSVRAARLLLDHQLPSDAAARAFLAMYFAACALLENAGERRPADPAAIISLFGFRFVKIGGMDLQHYQSLRRAHELCRLCEWKADREVTPAEAREVIEAAENLVGEACERLNQV